MTDWPKVAVEIDKDFDRCFVCGSKNPIGLKLKFTQEKKGVRSEFTIGELYQGWTGVVHGGIISCILDEAMSYATLHAGVDTLTARMQTRFKRPLQTGQPLVVTARVTRKTRKLVEAKAEMHLADGTPIADSTATMFILQPEKTD